MKYSMKNVFLYIMCFFVVALIVIFIVTETEENQNHYNRNTMFYSGEERESITIIEKEESTEDLSSDISIIEEVDTIEDATTYENWDIEVLIRTYFEAIRTCNVNMINSIVDSKEVVSEDVLKKKSEYIESYTNFTYYLKSGLVDKTYILYAIYEVQLKDIETFAPAIEFFYIKENSDGVIYISRLPLEGKYQDYLQEIEKTDAIMQMKNSVEERYNRACQTEEKLIELKDIINESIWISK